MCWDSDTEELWSDSFCTQRWQKQLEISNKELGWNTSLKIKKKILFLLQNGTETEPVSESNYKQMWARTTSVTSAVPLPWGTVTWTASAPSNEEVCASGDGQLYRQGLKESKAHQPSWETPQVSLLPRQRRGPRPRVMDETLHLGHNDPTWHYRLGEKWMESCSAEKDQGLLVSS